LHKELVDNRKNGLKCVSRSHPERRINEILESRPEPIGPNSRRQLEADR